MEENTTQFSKIYRNIPALEEASAVRIPAPITLMLKDNQNSTTFLDDGNYSGHIARFSQHKSISYFSIHIKLENSDKVFVGEISSYNLNQQLCELYKHCARNDKIDFAAAIGAYVRFTIRQNNSGVYPVSEITDLKIEAIMPRAHRSNQDSVISKQVLSLLNDVN